MKAKFLDLPFWRGPCGIYSIWCHPPFGRTEPRLYPLVEFNFQNQSAVGRWPNGTYFRIYISIVELFSPPLLVNSDESTPPANQALTEFTRSRGPGGEELRPSITPHNTGELITIPDHRLQKWSFIPLTPQPPLPKNSDGPCTGGKPKTPELLGRGGANFFFV